MGNNSNTIDETTTNQLEKILANVNSEKQMAEFMEIPKVADGFQTFPEYFESLEAVKALGSGELIRRSSLERSYYYQIMKGTRSPGRDKVLRLCLAAGLTLRETTRALELSGNAPLYPKRRRDIILSVAVNQKAGVIDTNLLLTKYGEEPLA